MSLALYNRRRQFGAALLRLYHVDYLWVNMIITLRVREWEKGHEMQSAENHSKKFKFIKKIILKIPKIPQNDEYP